MIRVIQSRDNEGRLYLCNGSSFRIGESLPLCNNHRRRKSGREGQAPNNLIEGGGGQHTLWPPNSPPPFPSISMCNRKKSQMYQVEG